MKNKRVVFEKHIENGNVAYRTLLKNRHGRKIFMELEKENKDFIITECWYFDRNIGKTGLKRKATVPLLFKTRYIDDGIEKLNKVMRTELDMCDVTFEFVDNQETVYMDTEKFIGYHTTNDKYRFLILVKSVENQEVVLETVLKNTLHRRIYTKFEIGHNNKAYIKMCYYCDRVYQKDKRKMPDSVSHGYIESFSRYNAVQWFNKNLDCDFNKALIITTDDVEVDINKPICGNI